VARCINPSGFTPQVLWQPTSQSCNRIAGESGWRFAVNDEKQWWSTGPESSAPATTLQRELRKKPSQLAATFRGQTRSHEVERRKRPKLTMSRDIAMLSPNRLGNLADIPLLQPVPIR